MSAKKRALFIRLDRIGDLVLTLPAEQCVQNEYDVHWFVPAGLDFVVQGSKAPRETSSLNKDFTWRNFFSVYKSVRQLKPDVSVSFHAPWWVNMALFLARVPTRGGVLSQWHSYLFLNKGLRQKRSRCEFHEMEYNFILVEETFDQPRNREAWRPLELDSERLESTKGMATERFPIERPYVVVHPGMGGSALNWPTSHYLECIQELSEQVQVVITGTQGDEAYLSPLKESLKSKKNVLWLDSQLNGFQLLKILANAIAVLAPSTGVLHLSASLGASSFGIYSPIQVHSPSRWGPRGQSTHVFVPKAKCPAQFECLGASCDSFPCMASITPQDVLSSIRKTLTV